MTAKKATGTPAPSYLADHAKALWAEHVGACVLTVDERVKAAAMCTALAEAQRASDLSSQSQPLVTRTTNGHTVTMVNPATQLATDMYEKAAELSKDLAHVLNPMRAGVGRSKLDQYGPIVLRAISRGFTQKEAAALAGIGRSTLTGWIDRGTRGTRKADQPYREFVEKLQHAKTRGIMELVDVVWEASKRGEPRLALDLLKVLNPRQYSERYMIEELKARVDVLGVEAFASDDERADVEAETDAVIDHIQEYLSATS